MPERRINAATAIASIVLCVVFGSFICTMFCCVFKQWLGKRRRRLEFDEEQRIDFAADAAMHAAAAARLEFYRAAGRRGHDRAGQAGPAGPAGSAGPSGPAKSSQRHYIVVQPALCESDEADGAGGALALATPIAISDNICAYGNGSGAEQCGAVR